MGGALWVCQWAITADSTLTRRLALTEALESCELRLRFSGAVAGPRRSSRLGVWDPGSYPAAVSGSESSLGHWQASTGSLSEVTAVGPSSILALQAPWASGYGNRAAQCEATRTRPRRRTRTPGPGRARGVSDSIRVTVGAGVQVNAAAAPLFQGP